MAIKPRRKLYTLCIIHEHPRVLLGLKKRGLGEGYWNGFGGKVEAGEDITESVLREVREEAGIDLGFTEKLGISEFQFLSDPDVILEVHVFKGIDIKGKPTETDEMKPQWFDVMEIPFSKMWADDRYWIPLLLKNKKFRGRFVFDKPSSENEHGKIVEHHLEVVNEL